jgi:hypothetical protein
MTPKIEHYRLKIVEHQKSSDVIYGRSLTRFYQIFAHKLK